MSKYLAAYAACAATILALDALWIGVIAKNLYKSGIGHLMAASPKFGVAAVFYALYVVGIIVLAIVPALAAGNWIRATVLGAVLGFMAYMAYDLTNLATLRDWPVGLSLIDLMWGTFLTATSATAGYFAAQAVAQNN